MLLLNTGVGRELHYPFDNSLDDFTILHFIKTGIFGSSRILRARPFGLTEASLQTELSMSSERDSALYGDLLQTFALQESTGSTITSTEIDTDKRQL